MNPRLPLLLACLCSIGWSVVAGKPTPVNFQLDWTFNVQFAGILVAKEKGYYRDLGLDVTLLPVDPEMKVVERVVAGTNWIGCAESSVLLAARAADQPIKVIGQMLQGSPMALLSFKERGLTSPANLVGKKIAIHPDGRRALEFLLSYNGLSTNQLTIVEQETDLTPLLDGGCDAVQGYTIDEAVKLELAGKAINVLRFDEFGYPAISQAYFTTEEFLRQNRPTVEKFIAASQRGWLQAATEPDAAVRLVLSRYAPGLDRKYQSASLKRVLELMTDNKPDSDWDRRLGPELVTPTPRQVVWGAICRGFSLAGLLPKRVTLCELLDSPISGLESGSGSACQPPPEYPWKVEQRRGQGEVTISAKVGASGWVEEAKLVKGSGSEELDDSCYWTVLNTWSWPEGKPGEYRIPFEFKLHPPVPGGALSEFRRFGGMFPEPPYRRDALVGGEQGTVWLLVMVGTDGVPLSAEILPAKLEDSILGPSTRTHVLRKWRWPAGALRQYLCPFQFVLRR